MANYQTTFFFEGVQSAHIKGSSAAVGWTETWYQNAASIDQALLFALDSNNYLRLRLACLGGIYVCKWVRCSDVLNPRLSKVAQPGFNAVGGARAVTQVTCALLVDFSVLPIAVGEPVHHRRMLLRGLPSGVIDGNVIDTTGVGWPAIRNFLNMVGRYELPDSPGPAPPWLIRFRDPAVIPVLPTALAVGANPKTLTVSAPLLAQTRGKRLRITSVKFPRGLNRVWTVLADAGAGGPYTLGTSRFQLAGVWDGSGTINPLGWLYRPASQYLTVGLRVRKVGRPFRLTRGRRSPT